MVNIKLLIWFPVYHLTNLVVSNLIVSWHKFTAIAYYVIDCFDSSNTKRPAFYTHGPNPFLGLNVSLKCEQNGGGLSSHSSLLYLLLLLFLMVVVVVVVFFCFFQYITHIILPIYIHVHIYIYIYVCVCMCVYVCVCLCLCVCVCVCAYTCVCVCMYILYL